MVMKHYIWLLALAILALWQSTQIQYWTESFQTLLISMPYIVVAIGVFITLWLNRIQPLLLLLAIGSLNLILLYFVPTTEMNLTGSVLFPVLTILLAVNFVLWIWMPEKGIYNKVFDSIVLAIFALQALLIYWLVTELPFNWIALLSKPIMENSQTIMIPFAGALALLLAGFLLSLKLTSRQFKVLHHAVIVALLLMAYGLNAIFEPGVLAWMSTMAAVVIVLSVVFDSHHIAYTDELTGMYGRRALMEAFLGLGKKYVLVMVDIDHFKKFNDTYGHDVGDDVLRTVASVLDSVSGGRAFRYGGEEFTLLFSGQTVADVMPELERLRKDVESQVLRFDCNGKPVETKVTISMGAAASDKKFKTAMEVLKFADEGLYQAKEAGRNAVVESKSKAELAAQKPKVKKPAAKTAGKTAAKATRSRKTKAAS